MSATNSKTLDDVIKAIDLYFESTDPETIYKDFLEAGLEYYANLVIEDPFEALISELDSSSKQERLNFIEPSAKVGKSLCLSGEELSYSMCCSDISQSLNLYDYGFAA